MKMSDSELFFDKFEVPLTTVDTERVIDTITGSGALDSRLIKEVYLPVHLEDGTSGRPFWYNYSREGYYGLIKRIQEHRSVVITYPHGKPAVMNKYINMGVQKFMVAQWKPEYASLKKKHKNLEIFRSIVSHAYSDMVDKRFDAMVVPYKRLLDIEWLCETSKNIQLIGIINHNCKVKCTNLNKHPQKEMRNTKAAEITSFQCPPGRNFFLPRQVVKKILPYLSALKLVERLQYCFEYEKFIKYYIGEEMLDEGQMGPDVVSHIKFYEGTIIDKLYPHSNLVEINCRFACEKCDRKCF